MFKSNTHGLNGLKQKLIQIITFASIGVLLVLSLITLKQGQVQGAPSTNLNFQARLLNANGTLVQDGDYHVEFKIYDHVSSGAQAQGTCSGNCVWMETRTGGAVVTVVNGFLSVNLGSVTAFGSSIDWSEEHYLTMNIGGSGGSPSWDGEMLPRIKLTAVPYAFQAEELARTDSEGDRGVLGFDTLTANRSILLPDASGTVCLQNAAACGFLTGTADDYIQNGTTQQADANFNILASTGVAATIEGASGQNILLLNQNGGTAALTVSSVGNATLAGDLAVNGGDITSTTGLNVTASNGAVVVTSTGSGNDITLTSADQIVLNAADVVIADFNASAGERILGVFNNDFSGAGETTYFQNINSNQSTYLNVVSSGTGTNAGFILHGGNGAFSALGNQHGIVEYNGATPALNIIATNSGSNEGGSINLITKPGSGGANTTRMTINSSGVTTFNPTGTDSDFSVQGDTNASLFYVDAGTDRVGIGDNTPEYLFTVGSGDLFGVNSSGNLIFEGSTADTNELTIAVADPTVGDATITIPDVAGVNDEFCLLNLDNCAGADLTFQDVYDNSTPPEFVVDDTKDGLVIKDASSAITGNLFAVQNNAGSINYLQVTSAGISVTGSGTFSGDVAVNGGNLTSTGALSIDTAADGNLTLNPNGTGDIVASVDTDSTFSVRNGGNDVATFFGNGTAEFLANGYTTTGLAQQMVYIDSTITKDNAVESVYGFRFAPTINVDADPTGFGGDVAFMDQSTRVVDTAITDAGGGYSFFAGPSIQAGGNVASQVNLTSGIRTDINTSITGTSTLTLVNLYGGQFQASGIGTGTTVTNRYGFKVDDAAGAGTLTNQFGGTIDPMTKGTNNVGLAIGEATGTAQSNLIIGQTNIPAGSYSIYNSSTDQNYFAGNLGIGDTSPDAKLDVETTITGTTSTDLINTTLTNQTTSGTQRGFVVTNANDATSGNTTEALGYFNNLDTTANTITDYLLIETASTDTSADAIDVSDSGFHNAINVGSNYILGNGIRQYSLDANTWLFQDTSGNPLMAIYTGGNIEVDNDIQANNDLAVLGGTGTFGDDIGIAGELILFDGGSGGNENSITINTGTAQSGNITVSLPDNIAGNDVFCLENEGNCTGANVTFQGVYDNSTPPEFTVNDTKDGLVIKDNSTPITGNLFAVQNNAGSTSYLSVTSSGINVTGAGAISGNLDVGGTLFAGTGDAFQVATNGNVTSGTINGQTISSTASFTGTVQVATSVTTPLLSSTAALAITPGGALTVGAVGQTALLQGSTTTITSAGQVIIAAGTTIELQDNTNITGNLDASGTLTAGTGDAFQVNASGNVLTSGTLTLSALDCTANANGGALTTDGTGLLSCSDDNDTTANAFLQGGNDFNATAVLGTTDTDALNIITSNTTRVSISATGSTVITGGTSGVALTVNNSTSTGNILVLQDNGTPVVTVADGGGTTFTGLITGQAGATISGGTINLNATGAGTVNIGNNTSNPTISIDSGTSSINIGTGPQSRTINIGTGGVTSSQVVTIGSKTNSSQINIHAGTNGINLNGSGSSNSGVVVKHDSTSTSAFAIQHSTTETLFRADTTSNILYVGNATGTTSAEQTLLVLDRVPLTEDLPTGVNGGIIYDDEAEKFMIFEGDEYKELCNMTDLGCGVGATVTLQDAYNNGSSILTTAADGDIDITLANDTTDPNFLIDIATGSTGEFKVQANGTDVLQIGSAGQLQLDVQGSGGGLLIGTDANLYRSASNILMTDDAFTVAGLFTGQDGATVSGDAISLNDNSDFNTTINSGTSTGDVTIGNNGASSDVTINSGGTINIGHSAQARTVNVATGNNSTVQTLTMGSTSGASTTLIRGGTGSITLTAAGGSTNTGTLINTSSDTTNAFLIQDSGTEVLFRANTTNNRLYVGNATGATDLTDYTLLVLDRVQETDYLSPGSGENGAIIYDDEADKFKVYEGGAWKTLCNTVDAGCGALGATQDLQEAYDNSATDGIIETSSSTKDIIFQSGSGFNSASMFMLQSDGDTLFTADTSSNRLYVGNANGDDPGENTLLVLDRVPLTADLPTGVNGGMIYDAEAEEFMIYDEGWKVVCNQTDLGCGSAGVAQSLQDAYNNSTPTGLIETTSTTKDIIFKSGTSFDNNNMFQIQAANGDELFVADTAGFRVSIGSNTTPANGVLTVGTDTSTAAGGIYFGTNANLYRLAANHLRTDGSIQLGEGANRTFDVQGRTTNVAGDGLTISAGDAGSGASAFAGGALTLQGGDAAGTGNANGGNITLTGGTGVGTGAQGLVVIGTPTFTTASVQNFTGNDSITPANVNSSGAVLISSDAAGYTVTLGDPIITTAGKILYVTNSGSFDMTLSINGGGAGNLIALKPNTSATMVWNGIDWTAAGASSSTDLQSAYNNTLTSAGGAELVLNAPGGSADGLTIRNNATTPITGGILEVQTSIGTNLFSVNNRGTELAANGGSETSGTWTTNWQVVGSGSVARTTTGGEFVTGLAGAEAVTTSVADDGIKNNLGGNPVNTIGAKYQVSFTAKSSVDAIPVEVIYSRNGGAAETACVDYVDGEDASQTLSDTEWTKVTCTIVIDSATAASDPDLIIRKTSSGSTPTIWIDNLSFMRNDTTTAPSNVQIGGGLDGGPITLFTLDRSSAHPVTAGNDTYLGSMYYDTVSGRIQCYEADGWGACGSTPNNYVNLIPEFAGAVLNGSDVGTMTADFCSNSGTLSVNSSLCASGQAQNFYQWTSPQASEQQYSIYVTYQLPAAFKNFDSNDSVTLTARVDSTSNARVSYEMFRSEGGSLVQCGTGETDVTSSANVWQTVGINGDEADFADCGFSSSSADTNIVFKINVYANSNANAYVGTLSFTTIGQ